MRDELLFEEYGGVVPADGDVVQLDSSEGEYTADPATPAEEVGAARSDSYAVPAFDRARRHLAVVDNWAKRAACVTGDRNAGFERGVLRRDGELLREAFTRQTVRDRVAGAEMGFGARLAAEEMGLRLRHFSEA